MTFIPLQWQIEAKAAVLAHGWEKGALVVAATGAGKTAFAHHCMMEDIEKGERVLWIGHRKELVEQPLATLNRFWPGVSSGIVKGSRDEADKQIVYASRDTIRSEDRLRAVLASGSPRWVIVDECFPAGTLVDGRPIEEIHPGDMVWSVDHEAGVVVSSKVASVMERTSPSTVTLRYGESSVTCTPNHPVLIKGRGYVEAAEVRIGDLCCVWAGVRSPAREERGPYSEALQGPEVQERVLGEDDGLHQQEVGLCTYEIQKSDARSGGQGKDENNAPGDGPQASGSRRERPRPDCVRASDLRGPWSGLDHRGCREDGEAEAAWGADALQARRVEPGSDGHGRGGRGLPLRVGASGAGREEVGVLVWTRVDGVSREEPGPSEGTRVYNLEVEGSHTYFANGVLVHNCHHSPAASYSFLGSLPRSTRFMGLTATPGRQDAKKLSAMWDIVYSYDLLSAVRDGVLVTPYASVCRIPELDLTKLEVVRGDYDPVALEAELLRLHVVDRTVEAILAPCRAQRLPFRDETVDVRPADHSCLVFTVSVDQAARTAAALSAAGLPAEVVHGEMKARDRESALARFARGELKALCSADALTEGTDLPIAKVVAIVRPTRSHTLFVQMCGRGSRRHGDAERSLILDLVGATREHSLVGAPVLVDGVDCPESADGQHRYLALETGEGRCQDCGHIVRCYGRLGTHKFKAGVCTVCGATQCPRSPTKTHFYMPCEDHKRVCIHCALELPDPAAALVGRGYYRKEQVEWQKLPVHGSVYATAVQPSGIMFNVQAGEMWQPYVYQRGRLEPLSPAPISRELARMLTDDVARQSKPRHGALGGHKNLARRKIFITQASFFARKFGLGAE